MGSKRAARGVLELGLHKGLEGSRRRVERLRPSSPHICCTDQVIGCDDVDKRKVGGQKANIVAVCRSGVLHMHFTERGAHMMG